MSERHVYDALIIGGGPAGATAAANLAMKGRRVAVLEKETFPRYHVGESMIPYCWFPLDRIGMTDKLRDAGFQKKYSVQFASTSGRISKPFYFFEHMDHEAAQTWQVDRARFDRLMLDNALEKGAAVFEGMKARDPIMDNGAVRGVRATDVNGGVHTFEAPVTIDASGRNGFFMTRNGWRMADDRLRKVAIWSYFKGAKRDSGYDEGATTVAYIPEKGWFWYIPMADDLVSVGVVAEKDYLYRDGREPGTIFFREAAENAWITDHLDGAEPVREFQVTGDYSYRSRFSAADGLVLTGDAFAFLDPVFSTGLFLAFMGGELAAEAVDQALERGDTTAARFEHYSERIRASLEAMRRLVYAFYDDGFNFGDLFKKYPDLSGDVTDCLIGNVDRDFSELFTAIAEFADVPEPLAHGAPFRGEDATATA